MKKTINYILLLSFFSIFLSVSCVKDNGNYDYVEVPELSMADFDVTIDGAAVSVYENNTILAKKGGVLEIDHKSKYANWENPTFVWTLIIAGQKSDNDTYIPGVEIGTAAKLSYLLTNDPGKYILICKVTSGENNDYLKINLSIETLKGLAILHKNASGAGDFTVLNTPELNSTLSEGQVVFENICAENNDGRKIDNPTFITVDPYSGNIMIGGVSAIEEYSKSTLALVSADYSRLFLTGQAPVPPFTPGPLSIEENGAGGTSTQGTSGSGFLFLNNLLYAKTRNSMGGSNKYGVVKQSADLTDNETYAPMIIAANTAGAGFVDKIAFNTTRKAFQMLNCQGYGTTSWGITQVFYPKNIVGIGEVLVNDTKMDIVSMGKVNSRYLCAVMKDNSGAYLMQFTYPEKNEISANLESNFVSKTPLSSLTGATETSPWAYGTRGDYVYYGVGNNLCIYNLANKKIIDCELGLPSNEIITKVWVMIDVKNSDYNGAILYVVTANSGEGKVHQYKITPLSGKPNVATARSVSGFGEVVDICIIK